MKPKLRILIVDDDPTILAMLVMVLKLDDYEVTTASSGEDAIRIARAKHFDLYMIDLILPCKDGIETMLALRAHDKKTPIIAMSGGGDNGFQNYLPLAEKIGASEILAKPFSRDSLLAIVGRVSGRSGSVAITELGS